MKVSTLLCASALALVLPVAVAMAAPSAAPSAASDEAPKFYRLAPDAAAEKACTDRGGKVQTDQDGNKMCWTQKSCPTGGATRSTKLDANDPGAAQKCKDACGTVSTDASGARVCTRPE